MRFVLTLSLLAVLLVGAGVAYMLQPRGYEAFVIKDVSQPHAMTVSSPLFPSGNGSLVVFIEGEIDGPAVLELTSNGGRDHQEFTFPGPQVAFVTNTAEAWQDSVQVRYRPQGAKQGKLQLAIYCGAPLSPDDRARYDRFLKNSQRIAQERQQAAAR